VIEKGLKPGERIVVEGVQKVRNGVKVTPITEVASPGAGAPQGDAKAAPAPAPEG
jgi:membrane fusion protein (multidrug efflux system)